ncbi:MAG: peptidylprolyl isomerase, partial [Fidelibacterota bacterium]
DHLYERLQSGERWEDLALETFRDPVLASNGGDLGFTSLGDLDPAYEEVAYQLADGEISPPVLTKTGYSIIQVIERNYYPFLIEEEFQAQREKLRQIIMTHLKRPSVRAYTDSILRVLHPRYDRRGLRQVLTQFDASASPGLEYPTRGLADTVVVFEGSEYSWSVEEVLDRLGRLAPRHQRRLGSEEDLERMISGLLVQDHMLAQARAGTIAEDEEFRRESRRAKKSYAVAQVLNHIISNAKLEESELRKYYQDHQAELVSEPRFEVLEIVVADSDTAAMIHQQLLSGEQFAVLARRHSLRKETAERGGYLGWSTPRQLGGIRAALAGANVGDLLGPLHLNGLEIIVKVLDIAPSVPLTLGEARPFIDQHLATQTRRKAYDRFRETLHTDADVRVDSTRIREFIFTEVSL